MNIILLPRNINNLSSENATKDFTVIKLNEKSVELQLFMIIGHG